jgi:FixJ family two-component response regulator
MALVLGLMNKQIAAELNLMGITVARSIAVVS